VRFSLGDGLAGGTVQSHSEGTFEWDEGNQPKIEQRFPRDEVESVFFDPARIERAAYTSDDEQRYGTVGQSNSGHLICIIFTYRGPRIRPISARPARRDERERYREENR
jgi:uncharacterized DUF497 family protein